MTEDTVEDYIKSKLIFYLELGNWAKKLFMRL